MCFPFSTPSPFSSQSCVCFLFFSSISIHHKARLCMLVPTLAFFIVVPVVQVIVVMGSQFYMCIGLLFISTFLRMLTMWEPVGSQPRVPTPTHPCLSVLSLAHFSACSAPMLLLLLFACLLACILCWRLTCAVVTCLPCCRLLAWLQHVFASDPALERGVRASGGGGAAAVQRSHQRGASRRRARAARVDGGSGVGQGGLEDHFYQPIEKFLRLLLVVSWPCCTRPDRQQQRGGEDPTTLVAARRCNAAITSIGLLRP